MPVSAFILFSSLPSFARQSRPFFPKRQIKDPILRLLGNDLVFAFSRHKQSEWGNLQVNDDTIETRRRGTCSLTVKAAYNGLTADSLIQMHRVFVCFVTTWFSPSLLTNRALEAIWLDTRAQWALVRNGGLCRVLWCWWWMGAESLLWEIVASKEFER